MAHLQCAYQSRAIRYLTRLHEDLQWLFGDVDEDTSLSGWRMVGSLEHLASHSAMFPDKPAFVFVFKVKGWSSFSGENTRYRQGVI